MGNTGNDYGDVVWPDVVVELVEKRRIQLGKKGCVGGVHNAPGRLLGCC